MAQPQILVLANNDAAIALTAAGFAIAGDDEVRRQTAAIVIDTRGSAGAKAGAHARAYFWLGRTAQASMTLVLLMGSLMRIPHLTRLQPGSTRPCAWQLWPMKQPSDLNP